MKGPRLKVSPPVIVFDQENERNLKGNRNSPGHLVTVEILNQGSTLKSQVQCQASGFFEVSPSSLVIPAQESRKVEIKTSKHITELPSKENLIEHFFIKEKTIKGLREYVLPIQVKDSSEKYKSSTLIIKQMEKQHEEQSRIALEILKEKDSLLSACQNELQQLKQHANRRELELSESEKKIVLGTNKERSGLRSLEKELQGTLKINQPSVQDVESLQFQLEAMAKSLEDANANNKKKDDLESKLVEENKSLNEKLEAANQKINLLRIPTEQGRFNVAFDNSPNSHSLEEAFHTIKSLKDQLLQQETTNKQLFEKNDELRRVLAGDDIKPHTTHEKSPQVRMDLSVLKAWASMEIFSRLDHLTQESKALGSDRMEVKNSLQKLSQSAIEAKSMEQHAVKKLQEAVLRHEALWVAYKRLLSFSSENPHSEPEALRCVGENEILLKLSQSESNLSKTKEENESLRLKIEGLESKLQVAIKEVELKGAGAFGPKKGHAVKLEKDPMGTKNEISPMKDEEFDKLVALNQKLRAELQSVKQDALAAHHAKSYSEGLLKNYKNENRKLTETNIKLIKRLQDNEKHNAPGEKASKSNASPIQLEEQLSQLQLLLHEKTLHCSALARDLETSKARPAMRSCSNQTTIPSSLTDNDNGKFASQSPSNDDTPAANEWKSLLESKETIVLELTQRCKELTDEILALRSREKKAASISKCESDWNGAFLSNPPRPQSKEIKELNFLRLKIKSIEKEKSQLDVECKAIKEKIIQIKKEKNELRNIHEATVEQLEHLNAEYFNFQSEQGKLLNTMKTKNDAEAERKVLETERALLKMKHEVEVVKADKVEAISQVEANYENLYNLFMENSKTQDRLLKDVHHTEKAALKYKANNAKSETLEENLRAAQGSMAQLWDRNKILSNSWQNEKRQRLELASSFREVTEALRQAVERETKLKAQVAGARGDLSRKAKLLDSTKEQQNHSNKINEENSILVQHLKRKTNRLIVECKRKEKLYSDSKNHSSDIVKLLETESANKEKFQGTIMDLRRQVENLRRQKDLFKCKVEALELQLVKSKEGKNVSDEERENVIAIDHERQRKEIARLKAAMKRKAELFSIVKSKLKNLQEEHLAYQESVRPKLRKLKNLVQNNKTKKASESLAEKQLDSVRISVFLVFKELMLQIEKLHTYKRGKCQTANDFNRLQSIVKEISPVASVLDMSLEEANEMFQLGISAVENSYDLDFHDGLRDVHKELLDALDNPPTQSESLQETRLSKLLLLVVETRINLGNG